MIITRQDDFIENQNQFAIETSSFTQQINVSSSEEMQMNNENDVEKILRKSLEVNSTCTRIVDDAIMQNDDDDKEAMLRKLNQLKKEKEKNVVASKACESSNRKNCRILIRINVEYCWISWYITERKVI